MGDDTRPNAAALFLGPSHLMVKSPRAHHGGYVGRREVRSKFCGRGHFRPSRSYKRDTAGAGAAHHAGAY